MSTRCQIGFYAEAPRSNNGLLDWEAMIYQHSDGYPDGENGVIANIEPFLKNFDKARGLSDTEYASARLLQHLCNTSDVRRAKVYEDMAIKAHPSLDTCGYGITKALRGDIEYYYAVSPAGIQVYRVIDDKGFEGMTLDKKNSVHFEKTEITA